MKKSLIASAVLAALVASSTASAALVYEKDDTSLSVGGLIEAMWLSTNASSTAGRDASMYDRARLNVDGSSKINDYVTGYGFFETNWEHNGTGSDTIENQLRYAYVGLDFGAFGTLQAGRFEQALTYVQYITDNTEEYGGDANIGDERTSGQFQYMWSGYGVDLGVQYQAAVDGYADEVIGADDGVSIDGGFGVFAGYTSPDVLFGPIAVKLGYLYVGIDDDNGEPEYDNTKIFASGLSWGNFEDGFYLGANYAYGKAEGNDIDDKKVNAFRGLISYGFDSGVVLNASYDYVKVENEYDDEGNTGTYKMKYVTLNAIYNFNESFRVWVEGIIDCDSDDGMGAFNAGPDGEGEAKSAFTIGARYTF